MELGDTYFQLLKMSERWSSTLAFQHVPTRVLCRTPDHGLQKIIFYFPLAKEVSLSCGCRRLLNDPAVIAEYTREKKSRASNKRLASDRNNPYRRTYETPEPA